MQFNLEEAVEKIKNNKDFLKLKNFVENNSGHDHEVEYDHCVKTYEIASKLISEDFIVNGQAKEKFTSYIENEVDGIKKRDLFQVTALIHDIGKIIEFDDNGTRKSLNVLYPNGTTFSPQHGYWGSKIVRDVTKEVGFSNEVLSYIENVVRLHVATAENWVFDNKMTADELIWDSKIKLENYHVDVMFSMYSDFFYHPDFQSHKEMMVKVFNNPNLYNPLNYTIVD